MEGIDREVAKVERIELEKGVLTCEGAEKGMIHPGRAERAAGADFQSRNRRCDIAGNRSTTARLSPSLAMG